MSMKATPKCSFIQDNFSREENRFSVTTLLAESFVYSIRPFK